MTFSRVVLSSLIVSLVFSLSIGQGAEQASSGFADAPGKELLMSKCFQCHSEKMWKDLKQDRRKWEGVLYRMVGRGALWTAANTGVPLLTVMTNNRVYYNDVEHQEKVAIHRGRPVENKLVGMEMAKPPVDFANLARSFSLHGEGPITEPEQIRPAVERAIKVIKEEKRPALVDVYMQHV